MVKVLVILLVIAVLMEDGSSMRKTDQERKEDEEVAKSVNATLAAEEAEKKKEEDERKKREEKKKATDEVKDGKEKADGGPKNGSDQAKKEEVQDNCTCPVADPCPEVRECAPCAPCPGVDPCPEEKHCPEEKPCLPCRPCGPCPSVNCTSPDVPPVSPCPEPTGSSMSVPVAMLVGASVSLLFTGVATLVGLLLRYVPPTISGFLILAIVIIIWYLCSHYPETARQLGGRVATLLREAATALGHRIMAAIRHHDQVSFSDPNPLKFEFHVS
jgi:hypothetical protein